MAPNINSNAQQQNQAAGDLPGDGEPIIADVVLLMDSNREHINSDRFWFEKVTRKVAAGNVNTANKIIDKCVFQDVKHAILHVGTNDVETRRTAANVAKI